MEHRIGYLEREWPSNTLTLCCVLISHQRIESLMEQVKNPSWKFEHGVS